MAFTGMPPGEVTEVGTPWKARKYSDGASSSMRRLLRLLLSVLFSVLSSGPVAVTDKR
jgi:hypothetical protein